MDHHSLYDLAPIARIALLGIVIALGPLAWVWLRNRKAAPTQRLKVLTFVTLFLTFDLILFGAFTRLTDSGLGCPDWPGCYGAASPVGAKAQISASQAALPDGPVTHQKAWIEMIHRYLATGVGVLILTLAAVSWLRRRELLALPRPVSPWWPTFTLVWVCVQGAFGALTVTMKLYPAIVTAHLLGGLFLLALLVAQAVRYDAKPSLGLSPGLRWGVVVVTGLVWLQIALGGWVSTNYAVLACTDFPTCHGKWWPEMQFAEGFTIFRELGRSATVMPDGTQGYLPFAALTAIHYTHRLSAYVVFAAALGLAWALRKASAKHTQVGLRPYAKWLVGLCIWQFVSGLSNVVLGWPLIAAVAHTAGAAGFVAVLAWLLSRSKPSPAA